ncbi:glycosyltransferase family 25 protein [Acetobacter persici]|uniref:Glycosyl transferase n=1 Tax=Acetobacter persici TaxID=1076596 RepID=A0A1U9LIS6_9PROT|nr:glycosyltransferase family 25 protein [Acetobacter persici]AQT06331.1 glycosyl transferase [Acetobacter persici]
MQKYVISLDRTPERLARFRAVNAHVEGITHAPGIDGKNLDLEEIKQKGFIDDNCQFTAGAIGSGLTHVSLWGAVAKAGSPAHIFEDDAFLCKNFEQEADRIIGTLPMDWDIILWGNNYDTMLQFELIPGITDCFVGFSEDDARKGIMSFRDIDITALPFKLKQTFGICGYAISAKGARELMQRCLPFTTVNFPHSCLGGRVIPTSSVDVMMNMHYSQMMSFTSFPALCLTDNVKAKSLNT